MITKENLIKKLKNENFSEPILNAFSNVKRENFIPEKLMCYAYHDIPLPLGFNSTISQPFTIAFMLNLLEIESYENLNILEIGSGCGYVLCLLNEICIKSKLFGIEVNEEVGGDAIERLDAYENIHISLKNGKLGFPDKAPFDRILLSAAAAEKPYHLIKQLNNYGIIVSPVGNSIFKIKKDGSDITEEEFYGFRFVPLV
ncbi:MAG: L-isoaspartyl protein carboxyl methyltransferase [bacterium]|nr:L-isoaspartyl protein carboxyl methyltransferase [bacterium]